MVFKKRKKNSLRKPEVSPNQAHEIWLEQTHKGVTVSSIFHASLWCWRHSGFLIWMLVTRVCPICENPSSIWALSRTYITSHNPWGSPCFFLPLLQFHVTSSFPLSPAYSLPLDHTKQLPTSAFTLIKSLSSPLHKDKSYSWLMTHSQRLISDDTSSGKSFLPTLASLYYITYFSLPLTVTTSWNYLLFIWVPVFSCLPY